MALLLGATLVACGPALPDQVTETRWLRYHHWADEQPCTEATEHLDGLVDFVASRFALRPQRLDYYKLRASQGEAMKSICPNGSTACASGAEAYTRGWADDHEVIHLLFAPAGQPPRLFSEGIAQVLGCGVSAYRSGPIDTSIELERLFSSESWLEEYEARGSINYDAAGSFVRYLLDTYGDAAFLGFYARAPKDGGDRSREVFLEEFGVTFDAALAGWRARAPGAAGSYCILSADPCLLAPDLDRSSTSTVTKTLSCIGAVASVEGGLPGAVAVGLTSSLEPMTAVISACDGPDAWRTVVFPPDVPGASFPGSEGMTSPGNELELRLFGRSRSVLRLHVAEANDSALPEDPQVRPDSALSLGGEVALRPIANPDQLWAPGCDAGSIPLASNAWGVLIDAPSAMIPATGGVLRLHSDQPVLVRDAHATSPALLFCQSRCGGPSDGGCGGPSTAAQTDLTVLVLAPPDAGPGRFSLSLSVSH